MGRNLVVLAGAPDLKLEPDVDDEVEGAARAAGASLAADLEAPPPPPPPLERVAPGFFLAAA